MNLSKNRFDSGVSPVVGVILMVAVTVILAAVIGTFVLDLGNNVNENPQAGVKFDQSTMTSADGAPFQWDPDESGSDNDATGKKVTVQIVSISNADAINVSVADNDNSKWYDSGTASYKNFDPSNQGQITGSDSTSDSGDTMTILRLTPGDKLSVIGTLEGKQTVLQTYTVKE